jgi:hypothetical protein
MKGENIDCWSFTRLQNPRVPHPTSEPHGQMFGRNDQTPAGFQDGRVYDFQAANQSNRTFNLPLRPGAHFQHHHLGHGYPTAQRAPRGLDMCSDGSNRHESDTKTNDSVTPPPSRYSNSNSSSVATVPSTPISTQYSQGGYYTPQAWSTPYAPVTYPLAYGAYGGAFPPGTMPMLTAPQGSEGQSNPGGGPLQWAPMYRVRTFFLLKKSSPT